MKALMTFMPDYVNCTAQANFTASSPTTPTTACSCIANMLTKAGSGCQENPGVKVLQTRHDSDCRTEESAAAQTEFWFMRVGLNAALALAAAHTLSS